MLLIVLFGLYPGAAPHTTRPNLTLGKPYSRSAKDIAVAPDGTIWIVSWSGAAHYQAQSDTWQTFPADPGVPTIFDHIQVGPHETVWISSRDFAAARLHNGTWTYYTGERNLIASSEPSIGTTSDGLIWFAPVSPPNSLVAFNPNTNTWKAFLGDKAYATDSVRLFTDGVVWRAAFGYASEYTFPASPPSGWKVYDRHIFSADETHLLPLGQGWIEAVAIDKHDTFWLAHSFGVGHFDPKTGAWQQFDSSSTHDVVSEQPQDIAAASDGSVWVASGRAHSLAFLLPPASDHWQQFDPRDGIPDAAQIDHVEVDQGVMSGLGLKTIHLWYDVPEIRDAFLS